METRPYTAPRRKSSRLPRHAGQVVADAARKNFTLAVAQIIAEGKLKRDVSGQSEIEMLEHVTALTIEKQA